ncbi:MAG: AI-2E family transporter [Gemmataceae bacterium]
MNSSFHVRAPGQYLIVAAAFVVVIAGMRAAETIVVPFLLAIFLAVIGAPVLAWLRDRRVPTVAALLLVAGALSIGVFLVVLLIGTSVADFSRNLPFYQNRLEQQSDALLAWLQSHGIDISEQLLDQEFNPNLAMQMVGTLLNGLSSAIGNALMILITVLFLLMEASALPAKMRVIVGPEHPSFNTVERILKDVRHYILLKTLTSLITGILVGGWLALIGVDYPVLWGVLAFLLNFIPNIGSIIAAVPPVLLAIVQLGWLSAVYAASGYTVINCVIGYAVEPPLMGRGLDLSALVVFLSLVFWGWVLGPVGMLLSVPLTMTVKLVLEGIDETRWLAILLGSEAAVTHRAGPTLIAPARETTLEGGEEAE